MLKRVLLSYEPARGYFVNLPTYQVIAGTFLPIQKGLMHRDGAYPNAEPTDVMALKPTVIVSAPIEDCMTDEGQVCRLKLSEKYQGNTLYDNADYQPPALLDFHPVELAPPKDATVFDRIKQAMGFGN